MSKSTLKLVSSKPEPVTRIRREWIKDSTLKPEGRPIVEAAYHRGPNVQRVTQYYRDSKNRRYVNIVYGDGIGPSEEIMD